MGDAPADQPARSSHAKRRRPLLVAAIAIAIAGWGLIRPTSNDPSHPVDPADVLIPGSAKGFNLLFVTLDTTRTDHLGCYGYQQAHTPTIDRLAAQGVRFDDAVTSVPLTLPSHSVMMTGQYPPALSVRDNGQFLADEHTTLAEILSTNGYQTAAFVAAFVLDERWGIAQGFETYDFHSGSRGRLSVDSIVHERQADAVSNSALRWLRDRSREGEAGETRPFFMWLHYFDPHYPYASPLANLPQFEGRPYDAEIAMADAELKRVLDALDKNGQLENTLIVFTTDHGEGFYEKDEAYHGIFLYESTLHAAMIFSNPKLFAGPCRVDDRVVGTVDLLPTILELLDLPVPTDLSGRTLRAAKDPDRAIYIETEFPLANGCAALYGLRRHRDKYINAPQSEYYDLSRDPKELDNLYDPASPDVQGLHQRLTAMLDRWSGLEITPIQPATSTEVQALQHLGYTGGTEPRGENLPDPKEHIHVINKITDVLHLRANGQLEDALALAKQVAAESEGWNVPIHFQAQLYEQLGRLEDAARVLLKQAQNFPSDKSYYDYAVALFKMKQYQNCLEVLEQEVLTRDPRLGAAHLLRGECLLELKRPADALAACQEAQRVDAERLGGRLAECLTRAREAMP